MSCMMQRQFGFPCTRSWESRQRASLNMMKRTINSSSRTLRKFVFWNYIFSVEAVSVLIHSISLTVFFPFWKVSCDVSVFSYSFYIENSPFFNVIPFSFGFSKKGLRFILRVLSERNIPLLLLWNPFSVWLIQSYA